MVGDRHLGTVTSPTGQTEKFHRFPTRVDVEEHNLTLDQLSPGRRRVVEDCLEVSHCLAPYYTTKHKLTLVLLNTLYVCSCSARDRRWRSWKGRGGGTRHLRIQSQSECYEFTRRSVFGVLREQLTCTLVSGAVDVMGSMSMLLRYVFHRRSIYVI